MERLDWLLLALVWLYLAAAPYNKVEESFNTQASHDLLLHGTDVAAYDHLQFPGVVPRTFLGPIALMPLLLPLKWLLIDGLACSKLSLLYAMRGVLGLATVLAFARFRLSVRREFGASVATWLLLISMCQFHLLFYASRALGNVYALVLVLLAYAFWIERKPYAMLSLLTAACAIFRSEILILFGPIMLQSYLLREVPIVSSVAVGLCAASLSIGSSVLVDSFFWQRWLWPEGAVFYYNAILGKSANWGTSPFHWYFSSALPRALLATVPLLPLGLYYGQGRLFRLLLPVVAFVAIYSFQPHKELRFVFYAIPILNLVAAYGVARLQQAGRKSKTAKMLVYCATGVLAMGLAISCFFVFVSSLNYPAGYAFSALHSIEAGEGVPHSVHIDVPAAMQGVSRFGELHEAWTYSKEEELASRVGFDYLVTGDEEVAGFSRFHSVLAYAGMQWARVGGLPVPLPTVAPRIFLHRALF